MPLSAFSSVRGTSKLIELNTTLHQATRSDSVGETTTEFESADITASQISSSSASYVMLNFFNYVIVQHTTALDSYGQFEIAVKEIGGSYATILDQTVLNLGATTTNPKCAAASTINYSHLITAAQAAAGMKFRFRIIAGNNLATGSSTFNQNQYSISLFSV